MSRELRLLLALSVFAAWPAAHHLLCRSQGVDPWVLGGWAMYCVPKFPQTLGMVGEANGEQVPLTTLPPPLVLKARAYNKARRALGDLLPPHALGGAILDAAPQLDAVQISVETRALDENAMVRGTTTTFRYER